MYSIHMYSIVHFQLLSLFTQYQMVERRNLKSINKSGEKRNKIIEMEILKIGGQLY